MDQTLVRLESWERAALRRLARIERREPEAQAAVLIRQGLEQAGVLRTYRAETMQEEDRASAKAQEV
jgi:hypothetical protein